MSEQLQWTRDDEGRLTAASCVHQDEESYCYRIRDTDTGAFTLADSTRELRDAMDVQIHATLEDAKTACEAVESQLRSDAEQSEPEKSED